MMTIDQIRQQFFTFFEKRGHVVVPPSSLLPDDPSVLLTTAGMQQFKSYYTGERDPITDVHASLGGAIGADRVVSIQPCVRTSDIDEVGDRSHLTFFEMIGNFAFRGAYFKREAIDYAWQFLTEELAIPADRLGVTTFEGGHDIPEDMESYRIWREIGIPEERIARFGREDNFWGPTGAEGPCGPTTEVYYDRTGAPCEREKKCLPNCPCGRFLEIWNLVFNEYFCDAEKKLTPLSVKGVDTGMGFERLGMALFDAEDVFETPFFTEALRWILEASPRFLKSEVTALRRHHLDQEAQRHDYDALRSARIVVDHLRTSVFLAHAGVLPSNVDRGYVLRRLIRRAGLHAQQLQLPEQWLSELLARSIDVYRKSYPTLAKAQRDIERVIVSELEKFRDALQRGLREFERLAVLRKTENESLKGADIFQLFETYGFPIEMSRELAVARGIEIDEADLEAVRVQHQERSRAGVERKFGGHGLLLGTGELRAGTEEEVQKATRLHTATHLLHAALRQVLGETVEQRGSDITAERLRFDFSFPRKVTPEEVKKVEELVNQKIQEDLAVVREEMSFTDAKASGALAFGTAPYPEQVSVYTVGHFSREVCGGPHVRQTGEIGGIRITKEEASAAGIRRVRALLTS